MKSKKELSKRITSSAEMKKIPSKYKVGSFYDKEEWEDGFLTNAKKNSKPKGKKYNELDC